MHLVDGVEDHRRSTRDRTADQVTRSVPIVNLGKTPVHLYALTVRTRRHVAEREGTGQRLRRRLELTAQHFGQSALLGFDHGAGVMGDELAQDRLGVLDVAQVASAVELVHVGTGKLGEVPDVVQPGRGLQKAGVPAEGRRDAACPSWRRPGRAPSGGEAALRAACGRVPWPRWVMSAWERG